MSEKQTTHHEILSYRTMGDKRERQQDIRKWMGSPGSASKTPVRRRRVMSTSDSEAERDQTPQRPLQLSQAQIPMIAGDNPTSGTAATSAVAPASPEVISLSSTSEDSMFIPLPRRQALGGTEQPVRQTNRAASTASRNNQRGNLATGKNSQRQTKSKKTQPKFCAEAEETSFTGSSSSNCSESDADAQCLYRSAITGVRNANNARMNFRRQTTNCPVCAKFAAYLQHFL